MYGVCLCVCLLPMAKEINQTYRSKKMDKDRRRKNTTLSFLNFYVVSRDIS